MTKYCPHCSGPNADFAKYCTYCGKPLQAPGEKKNQTLLVVLICSTIGLLIVFIVFLAIVLTKDNSPSETNLLQDSICLDSTAVEPADTAEAIPTAAATAEDITSTTAHDELEKLVRKASRSKEGEGGEDVFFGSLKLRGDYVVCTYASFCDYWDGKEDLLNWVMEDLANSKPCREMAQYAYQNGYDLKIVIEMPDDKLSYTYSRSAWLEIPFSF